MAETKGGHRANQDEKLPLNSKNSPLEEKHKILEIAIKSSEHLSHWAHEFTGQQFATLHKITMDVLAKKHGKMVTKLSKPLGSILTLNKQLLEESVMLDRLLYSWKMDRKHIIEKLKDFVTDLDGAKEVVEMSKKLSNALSTISAISPVKVGTGATMLARLGANAFATAKTRNSEDNVADIIGNHQATTRALVDELQLFAEKIKKVIGAYKGIGIKTDITIEGSLHDVIQTIDVSLQSNSTKVQEKDKLTVFGVDPTAVVKVFTQWPDSPKQTQEAVNTKVILPFEQEFDSVCAFVKSITELKVQPIEKGYSRSWNPLSWFCKSKL